MSERTHRHELEKNILADWLGEKIEVLKPYGTQIAAGGLILLVAIVGLVYYISRTDGTGPRAWRAYFAAFGEDKVAEALKEAYEKPEMQGTAAELWARLSYADQRFRFAAVQGSQDPTEAKEALADAEKALVEVEKKASEPALLARTRFSLARVYETQAKLNKAREYYEKVAETAKNTALGKAAAEGAERLDPKGEVAQVLTWLAEQKPLPSKTPGSDSFLDSLGPGFGQPSPTLPERPNLNVPGGGSPFGQSGVGGIDFGRDEPLDLKGPAPSGDDVESPPDTKAAEDTPADAKSSTEKAAEPPKAADEKPANEKAKDDEPSKSGETPTKKPAE